QEVAHQKLLREVEQRIDEFEAQIRTLRRESDSITQLLRSIQAGQGKAAAGRGVLATPLPGARVTSPFGTRVHPIFLTARLHTGVDYGASAGTPIRSAGNGVVVFAGSRGGYGNATIIDHGGSLATLYAHQSAIVVKAGQRVTRGQVIGRVGSTGFSTGPHLHFEVRLAGAPVDPLRYL
ncbi:MAG: M23 family metallopeptidase, partial [Acidimicrobiia bacterium]